MTLEPIGSGGGVSAATSYMRVESIALDLAHAALASSLPTREGLSRLATLRQMFDAAVLAPGLGQPHLRPAIALSLLARTLLDHFDDLTLLALVATAQLVEAELSP